MSGRKTTLAAEVWGSQEKSLHSPGWAPDIVVGEQGTCSPGFYFRQTGDKNVFFATGIMFPQTELLIGKMKRGMYGQWWLLFAFQQAFSLFLH